MDLVCINDIYPVDALEFFNKNIKQIALFSKFAIVVFRDKNIRNG